MRISTNQPIEEQRLPLMDVMTRDEDSDPFLVLSTEFHQYEDRVTQMIHCFTDQCQALLALNRTTKALTESMTDFLPKLHVEEQDQALTRQIQIFREKTIAPLESLVAKFPQIQHQLDHRRGAWETAERYRLKLEDMQRKTRWNKNARVLRNQIKHTSAMEQFQALDRQVQTEMKHILSQEPPLFFTSSFHQLMELEMKWGHQLCENATTLKHHMNDDDDLSKDQGTMTSPRATYVMPDHVKPETSTPENNQELDCPEEGGVEEEEEEISNGLLLERPETVTPPHPFLLLSPVKILQPSSPSSSPDSRSRLERCPKVLHPAGSRFEVMHAHIESNIAQGLEIAECVTRPEEFALEDWIRVHVIDLFNDLKVLYGSIADHICTNESCPEMSAGPCYTYLWADGETVVTPEQVSAPQYVGYLINWITKQMQNPLVFPEAEQPLEERHSTMPRGGDNSQFIRCAKTMLKRMFRVYAHIYHSHLDHFISLRTESQLNLRFKRFIHFVLEFHLVDKKELYALRRLISNFVGVANFH